MILFFKRVLLFCSPFLLLLLIYLVSDPFKILYNYDNYNIDTYIHKNRDFISTEMYLKNSKIYIYDSFIFGSSTALYIPPSVWGKYISTSNNIFSFDASGENIVGIWSKIKYIHDTDHQIKNAVIIFDTGYTFDKFINDNPIFIKHYKVYPSSRFNFHYKYFLNFLNLKFIIPFIHYKISNHFYPYMTNMFVYRFFYFDVVTNEMHPFGRINELKTDSLNYYKNRKELFQSRSTKPRETEAQINADHILMLKEIKEIFVRDSTDFRIVITPLFNRIAFNRNDLNILQIIFGEKKVFDFSGINKYTEKVSNYYDTLHFKKYVGAEILDSIYYSGKK